MTVKQTKPRTKKPFEALIFVDTNILLDFYRIYNGTRLELLETLESHKDSIITGSQIEMEYKKNRQEVILATLTAANKGPEWQGMSATPVFLANANPTKRMNAAKKALQSHHKQLKTRIERILHEPNINDPVYICLQRIFTNNSDYNLNREKKARFEIRDLARKRWLLGYPPRKQADTSIGDAINWEWILECADKSGKHVIIVTRDTDYGASFDKRLILNDWLAQEFKKRISQKRKLILTNSLAEALKLMAIPVTQAAETEERTRILEAPGAPASDTEHTIEPPAPE